MYSVTTFWLWSLLTLTLHVNVNTFAWSVSIQVPRVARVNALVVKSIDCAQLEGSVARHKLSMIDGQKSIVCQFAQKANIDRGHWLEKLHYEHCALSRPFRGKFPTKTTKIPPKPSQANSLPSPKRPGICMKPWLWDAMKISFRSIDSTAINEAEFKTKQAKVQSCAALFIKELYCLCFYCNTFSIIVLYKSSLVTENFGLKLPQPHPNYEKVNTGYVSLITWELELVSLYTFIPLYGVNWIASNIARNMKSFIGHSRNVFHWPDVWDTYEGTSAQTHRHQPSPKTLLHFQFLQQAVNAILKFV